MQLLLLGAAVAAVVWAALFPLRRQLVRWEMIDRPNARSSHVEPTPRGGGLAIVCAVLLGVLLWSARSTVFPSRTVGAFVLLGGAIAAIGWIDDRRPLSARIRLLVQLFVAIGAISAFGYIGSLWLPFVGSVQIGWFGIPLTLLWIVGLTNAYNFMDGIDGLAAGQAVIAGVSWLLVTWGYVGTLSGVLGLLVAAASFGFLLHNWPPARIFMGDVASGFLGFTFAILVLPGMAGDAYSDRMLIVGALFVGLFVGDATLTFARRLRNGERVFDAHRSHLYQRLTPSKQHHRPVTVLYLLLAILSAGCGFVFRWGSDSVALLSLLVAAVAMCTLVAGVHRSTRGRAAPIGRSN